MATHRPSDQLIKVPASPGDRPADRRRIWAALGYGALVWLIPFAVAMGLVGVRTAQRPLFESIMAVVVAVCGVTFGLRYLRHGQRPTRRHGLAIGLLWLAMSVAFDLPLMLLPPISMRLPDYVMDVAVTYLLYPVITLGLSLMAGDPADEVTATQVQTAPR